MAAKMPGRPGDVVDVVSYDGGGMLTGGIL